MDFSFLLDFKTWTNSLLTSKLGRGKAAALPQNSDSIEIFENKLDCQSVTFNLHLIWHERKMSGRTPWKIKHRN